MTGRLSLLALGCFALMLLLPSSPARADAIDGHSCHNKEGYLSIRGPDIVTPGGVHMQGDYGRHSFSYVAPSADPHAGETINMILMNEYTVHLTVGAAGETPPQVWHRCQAPVS